MTDKVPEIRSKNIAIMLRYYRKLKQLSVKKVSEILKENGIVAAPKTIYAWEKGTTRLTADTFMLLCELYGVDDVMTALDITKQNSPFALTEQENYLLNEYRKQPEMQPAVHRILNMKPPKASASDDN